MRYVMRKCLSIALVIAILLTISMGCTTSEQKPMVTVTVEKFDEYGGANLSITVDEFIDAGFEFGDTVDVSIGGKCDFTGIGFFSGYFEKAGQEIIVGYPGIENLILSSSQVSFHGKYPEVLIGDPVQITLNQKQAKKDVQEGLDLEYSNNREDYDSDEIFANFREITLGEINKGKLYRSANPCDNKYNRAEYADNLAKDNHINVVLNLADTSHSIEKRYADGEVNTEYYKSLFDSGKVFAEKFSNDYSSATFKENVGEYFTKMSKLDTPYLIHCTEGKDRTGFVCMLVEALMGATYEEMQDDYMITYKNYYHMDEENNKQAYDLVVQNRFDDMLRKDIIHDQTGDINSYDLKSCAQKYLLECGMTEKAIDLLKQKLA